VMRSVSAAVSHGGAAAVASCAGVVAVHSINTAPLLSRIHASTKSTLTTTTTSPAVGLVVTVVTMYSRTRRVSAWNCDPISSIHLGGISTYPCFIVA